MPTPNRLAIQDATIAAIDVSGSHSVLYAVYGDSNAAGNDSTQGTLPTPPGSIAIDWSTRLAAGEVPNIGGLGLNPNIGIWNKWTVGPNASRNSDADTGTDWHPGDCGLFDHGAATYLGLGQVARANAIEQSFGHFIRRSLLADGVPSGQPEPSPFVLRLAKYGVPGSVVHPLSANPAAGWHPTQAGATAYTVFTTRYLRPAITDLLGKAAGEPVYFGGSVVILGGTDAIEPAGPFTAPGDAENVDSNLQATVQGIHNFLGCPRAPTVMVLPPTTQENAGSNLGYPNMGIVRSRIASLAQRRTAAGYRTIALELQQFERTSDWLHYTNLGLWMAGRECARAMQSIGHRLQRITVAP